jgi:teichuronic acid biosynthesis glycosyltransferase TuaG
MIKDELVTIITPFYNSSGDFEQTFNSVIQQTYIHWHWIIVDDSSESIHFDRLKEFVNNDFRITIIRNEENLGAGASRNKALEFLSPETKYLTFLDADDFWDIDFLHFFLELFVQYDIDILYGGYKRIKGNIIDFFLPMRINNHHNILRGCDISCLATLIKLKPGKFGYRFGNLPVRNDLVFYWSLLKDYSCFPIPIVKSTYRLSDNSLSANKFRALKWQWIVNYKIAKVGIIKSLINCIFWSIRGFTKYKFENSRIYFLLLGFPNTIEVFVIL